MTQVSASLLLTFSLAVALFCFRGIVRRYRTLLGFPWLLSAGFAAAAVGAVLAFHALIDP